MSNNDPVSPLETLAGGEFLASVEVLDIVGAGSLWLQKTSELQRRFWREFVADLQTTASMAASHGVVHALTDHGVRRVDRITSVVMQQMHNDVRLHNQLLRAHQRLFDAGAASLSPSSNGGQRELVVDETLALSSPRP